MASKRSIVGGTVLMTSGLVLYVLAGLASVFEYHHQESIGSYDKGPFHPWIVSVSYIAIAAFVIGIVWLIIGLVLRAKADRALASRDK